MADNADGTIVLTLLEIAFGGGGVKVTLAIVFIQRAIPLFPGYFGISLPGLLLLPRFHS